MFKLTEISKQKIFASLSTFLKKAQINKLIKNTKETIFKNISKKYDLENNKNKKNITNAKNEFNKKFMVSINNAINNIKEGKTPRKLIKTKKQQKKQPKKQQRKKTKKQLEKDYKIELNIEVNKINNEIKKDFENNNKDINNKITKLNRFKGLDYNYSRYADKYGNQYDQFIEDIDKDNGDNKKIELENQKLNFNDFITIENNLRQIRKLNGEIIYQLPYITNKQGDIIDKNRFDIYKNIDKYIDYIIFKANKVLYNENEINNALCQIFYMSFKIDKNNFIIGDTKFNKEPIYFEKDIKLNEIEDKIILDRLRTETSGIIKLAVGYRIIIQTKANEEGEKQELSAKSIYDLKAFNPSNDRKYHELTTRSTTNNKICIYETFLILNNMMDIKYNTKNNNKFIMDKFNKEEEHIKNAVKNGELINSIQLLNKKYKISKSTIFFYNNTIPHIRLDNNDIKIIDSIKNGTKIYLYDDKKEHVAPSIYNDIIFNNDKKLLDKVIKDKYILKPTTIKDKTQTPANILKNCLIYDLETYTDNEYNVHPYCCCLYGFYNGKEVKKSFYGLNCIDDFINYININLLVKISHTSTKPNKEINYIRIYGFNNSKFDNLFVYKKLYELDKGTDFIFAGSSIKYIEYNNISFYDLALIYSGTSLRKLAEDMKVENKKGIFPYTFVNKDNLYYNGSFPDEKYFNNTDFEDITYNELKEKNNNKFDVEDYTLKYCLLDCITTYDILKNFINSTIGEINGKYYNVSTSKTGAGLAMKSFNQIFQDENLEGSPEDVLKREKKAYYGGRTEVFKKYFKSNDKNKLNYYDINSSYPYSMTQNMPFKYIRSIKREFKTSNKDDIINTNLYHIKAYKYNGNDNYVINNLLERNEKGFNYSVKEYNGLTYHWGVEIREAINNNFQFDIIAYDEYSTKKVFETYVNYFYNERKKVKKSNPALGMYYKLLLNSLYGKFGQKQFDNNEICNNINQIWKIVDGGINRITAIEDIDDKLFMVSYEQKGDNMEYVGNLIRFSSYISAFSRTNLSIAMRSVGFDNVYYCDTDSIFTNGIMPDNLLNNDILGKWKKENETNILEAIFTAPKVYYYKTDDYECKKGKGIKGENLKKDDYEKMAENKTVSQTNNMFFRSLNGVKIKPQERNITAVLNKRKFNKNDSIIFNNYDEYIESN
jgi:hypothetical protein